VSNLGVCRYAQDPERFLALLARSACPFADPVSFSLGARYYQAYFADRYRGDASFIVHDGGAVLAVVRGQAVGDTIFDNGQGVSVYSRSDRNVDGDIVRALEETGRTLGCGSIRIADPGRAPDLDSLGRHLLNRRAEPRLRLIAIADLMRDEGTLRGGLRKSFRSLVNWGSRELRMQYVTAAAFDAEAFESFRAFHVRISGRETRSRESWNIQAEMIRAGRGELLLSHLDGHGLVSASLFLDTGSTATYGVGVYERDLFEKPLSHAPLFTGMLRAKERGQTLFVIGDVPPASGAATDKEFSIGQFKSGFSDTLLMTVDWTLSIAPTGSAHG
jgi:hypothetical protein